MEIDPHVLRRAERGRVTPWRRPLLLGIAFGYRLFGTMIAALPLALFSGKLMSGFPDGDARVLEPGGELLIELVRHVRPVERSLGAGAAITLLLLAAGGLLPMAALVAGVGHEGRLRFPVLSAMVSRALPALAILYGFALALEAMTVVVVVLVGNWLVSRLGLSARADDVARVAVGALAGLGVVAIGVVHDLARVAVIDEPRDVYSGALVARRTLRRAPLRVAWAYLWRGALVVLAIAVTLLLSRVPAGFLIRQIGVAAAVVARASWLAAALRWVRETQELDDA